MQIVLALSLVLTPQAPASQAERFQPVDVVSAGGRFAAHVRKAEGQEHVDDLLARWLLTVEARDRDGRSSVYWSSAVQHRAGERLHFVGDDGLGFVEVDPHPAGSRELVRVWHASREPYSLDANELSLDHVSGTWLAAEHGASVAWFDSPLGPVPQLLLVLAEGGERRVDLASGAVFTTREWTSELAAGPIIAEELRKHARPSYVKSATAPARVYFGESIEIVVDGAHPTPGWHFAGFDARVELVETVTTILLTPLSLAPPDDRAQAQIMRDFRCTATLAGLAPGHYEVRVLGLGDEPIAPLELDVLPARPWVELEFQSAGVGRTVRVYPTGVAVEASARADVEPRIRVLDAEERARLELAFAGLPRASVGMRESDESRESGASERVEYRMRWTLDDKHLEARYVEASLDPATREFVRVLLGAAR